jgi:hypothetical protein
MVTDRGDSAMKLSSGRTYTITLSAAYDGSTQSTSVNLLVGGQRLYLPLSITTNIASPGRFLEDAATGQPIVASGLKGIQDVLPDS